MTPEEREALADQVGVLLNDAAIEDYHAVLTILGFRRPWKDSNTGWAGALDQLLHVVYAVVVFLPVIAWPSYWAAALSGLIFALIREWEQWRNWDYKLLLPGNRLLDVTFFVVGALLVYYLVHLVQG